jgi:hypothetical protein
MDLSCFLVDLPGEVGGLLIKTRKSFDIVGV